jgi:hypothetical protein
MKKFFVSLFLVLAVSSFGKKKQVVPGLAVKNNSWHTTKKTLEMKGSSSVKDNREKYFSSIEWDGKTYKLIFTEDTSVLKYVMTKLKDYKDTGILAVPIDRKIFCLDDNGLTTVFFDGDSQVSTIERNKKMCSKKPVSRVLALSEKVNAESMGKITPEVEGKIFVNNLKKAKEIFE